MKQNESQTARKRNRLAAILNLHQWLSSHVFAVMAKELGNVPQAEGQRGSTVLFVPQEGNTGACHHLFWPQHILSYEK